MSSLFLFFFYKKGKPNLICPVVALINGSVGWNDTELTTLSILSDVMSSECGWKIIG